MEGDHLGVYGVMDGDHHRTYPLVRIGGMDGADAVQDPNSDSGRLLGEEQLSSGQERVARGVL